jgi:hypothetical protein
VIVMSSHVVVQVAAVFAAATMVRRRVPGMAGPWARSRSGASDGKCEFESSMAHLVRF